MAARLSSEEILAYLAGNNSVRKQQALKYITRHKLTQHGPMLLGLLQADYAALDGSSKAQYYDLYYLCLALGAVHYLPAVPVLEAIAGQPGYLPEVGAAMSFLRLTRTSLADFSGCLLFLDNQLDAMRQQKQRRAQDIAALTVICNDKMVPDLPTQQQFVAYGWQFVALYETQTDYHLHPQIALFASCCAGFEHELVKELLYKIMECGRDGFAGYFAKDALAGKYTSYNPAT